MPHKPRSQLRQLKRAWLDLEAAKLESDLLSEALRKQIVDVERARDEEESTALRRPRATKRTRERT